MVVAELQEEDWESVDLFPKLEEMPPSVTSIYCPNCGRRLTVVGGRIRRCEDLICNEE